MCDERQEETIAHQHLLNQHSEQVEDVAMLRSKPQCIWIVLKGDPVSQRVCVQVNHLLRRLAHCKHIDIFQRRQREVT